MEEWRDVKGYEGIYQVSNLGRVKRLPRYVETIRGDLRMVRLTILRANCKDGYPTVNLCLNGKGTSYKVHRLVALAFIPNPDNKPHIDHINMIRDDNRVENLDWVTQAENNKRALAKVGRRFKTQRKNGLKAITAETVLEICKSLDNRSFSQKELSDTYGVSVDSISNIHRGITWDWLTNRKSKVGGKYTKSKT